MRSTGTGVQHATAIATAMSTTARDRGGGGGGYSAGTSTTFSAIRQPLAPPSSPVVSATTLTAVEATAATDSDSDSSDSSRGGDGGGARAPNLASRRRRADGDGGGTCMPTLADREDWDEGFLVGVEECGGWDEEYDWLDDREERREESGRRLLVGWPGSRLVHQRRSGALYRRGSSHSPRYSRRNTRWGDAWYSKSRGSKQGICSYLGFC